MDEKEKELIGLMNHKISSIQTDITNIKILLACIKKEITEIKERKN